MPREEREGEEEPKTPLHPLLPDLAPTGPSLADTTFLRRPQAGSGVRTLSASPTSALSLSALLGDETILYPVCSQPCSRVGMPGLGVPSGGDQEQWGVAQITHSSL